jgi:ABC-type multidrug transport system permease subunit
MGVLRSKLGWALVVIYVVAFIAVYFDVQEHRGTFLYDIWLDLLAVPYILIVGRLLLGQPTFEVHAHEPWGLVPAVIFCSGVVLLVGAGLERAVRALWALVRRGRRPK